MGCYTTFKYRNPRPRCRRRMPPAATSKVLLRASRWQRRFHNTSHHITLRHSTPHLARALDLKLKNTLHFFVVHGKDSLRVQSNPSPALRIRRSNPAGRNMFCQEARDKQGSILRLLSATPKLRVVYWYKLRRRRYRNSTTMRHDTPNLICLSWRHGTSLETIRRYSLDRIGRDGRGNGSTTYEATTTARGPGISAR